MIGFWRGEFAPFGAKGIGCSHFWRVPGQSTFRLQLLFGDWTFVRSWTFSGVVVALSRVASSVGVFGMMFLLGIFGPYFLYFAFFISLSV